MNEISTSRPPRTHRGPGSAEYRLKVDAGTAPTVCVLVDNRIELRWEGDVARRLLEKLQVEHRYPASRTYALGKKQVQCIALQAAALKMRLDAECRADEAVDARLNASERLWDRLIALGIRIPTFHTRVAQQLFRYPGVHLSAEEAVCILSLEFSAVDSGCLYNVTAELARWGILQRIDVEGIVFYDIDTRPHLHIYRSQTRELVDAPSCGVLRVG